MTYWKQRGRIKGVVLEDENTKFFHAHATIKYKRKAITSLKNASGEDCFTHEAKATLLWESYKEQLGTTEFSEMLFNLSDLLQRVDPFSKEEIDSIIKNLPSEKSPGPDGFNTDFLKKCWSSIAQDFYDLCQDFLKMMHVLRVLMAPISLWCRRKMLL
jgi:hypothetical protein